MAMIALQTRYDGPVQDLSHAGFTPASLHKAIAEARVFQTRFNDEGSVSAILGLHNVRQDDWAEKLLRRQPLAGAIITKLGSNGFAKRRPDDTSAYERYINAQASAEAPLLFRVGFGPVKNIPCNGCEQTPDLAEYLTLIQLGRAMQAIAMLYPHGVQVQLVPDDLRSRSANLCPLCFVDCYITGLQRMVRALNWDTWLRVEPGQTRLYREYRVADHFAAAERMLDRMRVEQPPAYTAKWNAAVSNAGKNLAYVDDHQPEADVEASARRYMIAQYAERLSGMWDAKDALPLRYGQHEQAFQMFTMTQGRTKLPWQIAIPLTMAPAELQHSLY